MVTTTQSDNNALYEVDSNGAFNGVVKIETSTLSGTGTLLFGGRAVLTAAHLFSDNRYQSHIIFDTPAGRREISSSKVLLHPDYDRNMNHDLAIVWLAQSVDPEIERYDLYRQATEVGQTFEMVGYGLNGLGSEGYEQPGWFDHDPDNLKASNTFDATSTHLNQRYPDLTLSPAEEAFLLADFDSGTHDNDALGQLLFRHDQGLGDAEGMIAPGDSGGPAFIDGQVAGVASYIISLSTQSHHPDINNSLDSSYGEIGFWQRVSQYQEWIDKKLRAQHNNAPSSPEEVKLSISEGDEGEISYAYFFIYLQGDLDQRENISIEYATRDGSANMYEDYMPVDGTLMIYSDEEYVALPVEIIGDGKEEGDEIFWLDIWGPQGARLFNQKEMISVSRTIVDNDTAMERSAFHSRDSDSIEFLSATNAAEFQDIWS